MQSFWHRQVHLTGALVLDRVADPSANLGKYLMLSGRYGRSIRTSTRRSAANSKIRRPDYLPTLRGISVVE